MLNNSLTELQIAQNAPSNVRIGSAGQSEKLPSKKNSGKNLHVNDVVTDWSYSLARFLVSTLFGFFVPQTILATFHIALPCMQV